MDIAATWKININQFAYREAYTYCKVLMTVCSTPVVTTAMTFRKLKINKNLCENVRWFPTILRT